MQKYIKDSGNKIIEQLKELRKEININDNNVELNNTLKKAEKIYKDWKSIENKWSLFVLHEELDSIETSLVSMRANIKTNNYDICMEEIDKSIFLLNHIYEKERLSLKNIF